MVPCQWFGEIFEECIVEQRVFLYSIVLVGVTHSQILALTISYILGVTENNI